MKKFIFLFPIFFSLVFPIFAQFNGIQKDAINLNNVVDEIPNQVRDDLNEEHIKSFDSAIKINKDGTIDVKETIVYDFSTLDKHGIYREIPYIKTNQDGKKYELKFNNFSVINENGNSYKFVKSWIDEKLIRLKIGDADRLITGIHTYVISYKVSGALTYFSDHDELYWNVTGNEWQVPITDTTASVAWPQEVKKEDIKTVCYTGVSGSRENLCSTELPSWDDRPKMVTKTNNTLLSGEGLSVVVSFPKNIVAVLEPKEFVSFWNTFIGKLVGLVIGLLAFIWYLILPFYIIYRWMRYGRDPKEMVGVTTAWYEPPKTPDNKRFLTPGEVGTLGDETVDLKDISATIVDLARRGYIKIEERAKRDFFLVRRSLDEGGSNKLLPFERLLIDKFFKTKNEIRLKNEHLFEEVEKVKNSLYEQIVENKFFPKNPQTIRTKYYILAGVALFTANFGLAIVSFIFGRVMPRKTVDGVNAKNVAFSLRNFLTSQERQLKFQADKQLMFEKLLPYAVAFGVEKIWAKRFKDLNIKQPDWYQGYSNGQFNSWIFVSSLNSSMKSFQTSATPTRSSSGFSSGFSGGFSGGGGGGGGGGSW